MSVSLNGTTDSVNAGANPYVRNVAQGALMAWIMMRTLPANGTSTVVIGVSIGTAAGLTGSSRASLELRGNGTALGGVGGTFRRLDADAGNGLNSSAGKTGLAAGLWAHFAVVINYINTALTAQYYVNGALAVSLTGGNTGGGNTSDTDCQRCTIGSDEGLLVGFFDGLIEDARIYNRFVGPAEMDTIYNARGADRGNDNCAGRYGLNELGPGQTFVQSPSLSDFSRTVGVPGNGAVPFSYGDSIIRGTRSRHIIPIGYRG